MEKMYKKVRRIFERYYREAKKFAPEGLSPELREAVINKYFQDIINKSFEDRKKEINDNLTQLESDKKEFMQLYKRFLDEKLKN